MEQVRGLERQLKSLQAKLDNSETEAAKLRRELQKAEIDVSDLNRYTKMLTHMKDNSDKAKEEAIKERLKAEDLLREAKQARNVTKSNPHPKINFKYAFSGCRD